MGFWFGKRARRAAVGVVLLCWLTLLGGCGSRVEAIPSSEPEATAAVLEVLPSETTEATETVAETVDLAEPTEQAAAETVDLAEPAEQAEAETVDLTEPTEQTVAETVDLTEPTEQAVATTETTVETTEAPTESPATEPQEELVWVPTRGGTKYHSSEFCSGMVGPDQVTLTRAKALGFTPCKKCH